MRIRGAVLKRNLESHARRGNFERASSALRRPNFRRRPCVSNQSIPADLWRARFPGQRLIPGGNQGFVCWTRVLACASAPREVSSVSQRLGTRVLRKEDPALLSGRGRYADDLPVPAGTLHAHVIRSPHPHADIVQHRRGRGAGEGRRLGRHHRRRHQKDFRSVPGRAEVADPSMVARGRPRALRRRAGRAGGGGEPLSRRRRRRAGADRIRAARSGDRSARSAASRRRRSCTPRPRPTKSRSANFTTATPRARSRRPTRSSS